MSRSIQVGDFVQISLHGFIPSTYVIRQIDQSGIYVSQDSSPNEFSLIIPIVQGQGGWKVHGSDENYVIQFVANPDLITQLTQSLGTLQIGQPIQEAQIKSIGTILTGEPNVDILILAQLDDAILSSTCQVDKYAASLCRNDVLWNQKVINKYLGAEKFKSKDKTWKEYYKELKKTDNDPNRAAASGYLEVLKWLAEPPRNMFADKEGANQAALNGHLEVLKWLASLNIFVNQRGANDAALSGHLEVLKWLAEPPRNIFVDQDGANLAAEHGHLEVLKWLAQPPRKIFVDQDAAYWAAANGHLEVLKWLAEPPRKIFPDQYAAYWAASQGQLEVLKWLAEPPSNIFADKEGANNAAFNGQLEVLKWLASLNIFVNQRGANDAAFFGHLEVLKWLAKPLRNIFSDL